MWTRVTDRFHSLLSPSLSLCKQNLSEESKKKRNISFEVKYRSNDLPAMLIAATAQLFARLSLPLSLSRARAHRF